MSEIRATTISDAAGTGPISLTGQSAAKAWLKSNYTSGAPVIQSSLNVSSLADSAVGQQNVSFTNAMAGANDYAAVGAVDDTGASANARVNYTSANLVAGSFLARTYNIYSSDGWADTGVHITVDGDLA
jgi:hypothetical protein